MLGQDQSENVTFNEIQIDHNHQKHHKKIHRKSEQVRKKSFISTIMKWISLQIKIFWTLYKKDGGTDGQIDRGKQTIDAQWEEVGRG
jgi:hypothetical protein